MLAASPKFHRQVLSAFKIELPLKQTQIWRCGEVCLQIIHSESEGFRRSYTALTFYDLKQLLVSISPFFGASRQCALRVGRQELSPNFGDGLKDQAAA